MRALSEFVKTRQKQLHLTQAAFAEKAGFALSVIRKTEKGKETTIPVQGPNHSEGRPFRSIVGMTSRSIVLRENFRAAFGDTLNDCQPFFPWNSDVFTHDKHVFNTWIALVVD